MKWFPVCSLTPATLFTKCPNICAVKIIICHFVWEVGPSDNIRIHSCLQIDFSLYNYDYTECHKTTVWVLLCVLQAVLLFDKCLRKDRTGLVGLCSCAVGMFYQGLKQFEPPPRGSETSLPIRLKHNVLSLCAWWVSDLMVEMEKFFCADRCSSS